jgi:hypothetical protein
MPTMATTVEIMNAFPHQQCAECSLRPGARTLRSRHSVLERSRCAGSRSLSCVTALVSVKAVPIFSLARCLRNLGSMKDAVCLGKRYSADTHGFRSSPDHPNRASEGGTSMVGHAQIVLSAHSGRNYVSSSICR